MFDLTTQLGPLRVKNPITVASGTFGSKDEYADLVDYNRLGAVVTKSVSIKPYMGNAMPRICETPAGMLNAIGLQNAGIDDFIENKVPYFDDIETVLIVSIAGHSAEEYIAVAERLNAVDRVDAIEVNISCPNVSEGGIQFGMDPVATKSLISQIKGVFHKPIVVKLSPEGDILKSAEASIAGGADALALINTLRGMAVDITTKRPLIANVTGGLSGPAIRPVAIRCVYEVKKHFDIPVIAMGGVASLEDVLEFLIVGADMVALGTVNFVRPTFPQDVIGELEAYCDAHGITHIDEIRNSLEVD